MASQIDYILVRQADMNRLKDVIVVRDEEFALQHKLVIAVVSVQKDMVKKKVKIRRRKI